MHRYRVRRLSAPLAALMAAALASGLAQAPTPAVHAAPALGPVTITGVTADNSSVKIDYLPVPGAADYRVFDVASPATVKYAGMLHLQAPVGQHFVMQGSTPQFPYTTQSNLKGSGPATLDVPNTEIQWNAVEDRQPHIVVVQALSTLGEVPLHNLTDDNNNPLYPPPGMMLGSNEGNTPDGYVSINGQGPFTQTAQVIAASAPFTVQANAAYAPVPSVPDAQQDYLDTFEDSEAATLQQVGTANCTTGVMTYTLNTGTPRAAQILYQGADTDHSRPFIDSGHFMDVLYDGPTPRCDPPWEQKLYHFNLHGLYTNMSFTPNATADFSGGRLLHVTVQVDSFLDATNRWLAFQLAPAANPLTQFEEDDALTQGGIDSSALPFNSPGPGQGRALWVQLFAGACDATVFQGPTSPSNPAPVHTTFLKPFVGPCLRTEGFGGNDNLFGLDDRVQWDLFVSNNHLAIFENGQLMSQGDIPGGLNFSPAKVYVTHYLYATNDQYEVKHMIQDEPYLTYWINYFPHSDERHWDNLGFEVLPASYIPSGSDWSGLSTLIRLPGAQPARLAP